MVTRGIEVQRRQVQDAVETLEKIRFSTYYIHQAQPILLHVR